MTRRRGTGRRVLLAATVLVAAGVLSLLVGSQGLAPSRVWTALVDPTAAEAADRAVVVARVARTLVACVVGGALALAGAALQGMARNPLADPGILGLNAGAATAVVLGIYLGELASPLGYVWTALGGAAIAFAAVYAIASIGRDGATPGKLVLAGAAMTAGLTGVLNAVLLASKQTLDTFRLWQVGSVGGRGWDQIGTLLPFLVVGAALVLLSARALDAAAVGDDLARGLGARLWVDRTLVATGVVLLCGAATALAGPIAFVGLVVPHALRLLGAASYTSLLPLAVLVGGALLVVADTVGRVIAPPAEMQVGVMTALIGVPVFVWVVRRGRQVAL